MFPGRSGSLRAAAHALSASPSAHPAGTFWRAVISSSHTPSRARALRRRLSLLAIAGARRDDRERPARARRRRSGGAAAPGHAGAQRRVVRDPRAWTCARGQVLTLDRRGPGEHELRRLPRRARAAATTSACRVRARAAATGELLVVVPRRARSGPLKLVSAFGAEARSPQPLTVLRQAPGIDDAKGLAASLAGGRRTAVFAYRVTGRRPGRRRRRGGAGRRRRGRAHAGRSTRATTDGEVRWDGFAGERPVRSGTYVLRLERRRGGRRRPPGRGPTRRCA